MYIIIWKVDDQCKFDAWSNQYSTEWLNKQTKWDNNTKFLKLLYFNWRIITFQYCDGFCHISTGMCHGCACVPWSWMTPSQNPPQPVPLRCPRAPALGVLLYASNLHCSSTLHTAIYMFQCYFLILSHPCLLPQSPKVCYLHLCLFCCLAYRVISTIFLNSICMH